MIRLIAGARGRVRPLSACTRQMDETQAAALAGLGAGSLRDRGFMFLYAWMRKAAFRKHSRRWPAASAPLLAAGSSRQGEVPSMPQKAHHLRQCGSSFFLVVAGRLSSMMCAQSPIRARRSESSPTRKRSRDVSARSESCSSRDRCDGSVTEEGRAAIDARNGDSGARSGELGEAERSRDGGGEAGRADAGRRGDVAFVPFAGAPILVPARGAQRANGRTAALWSTGVGRTETGRTTVGVGVRSGSGGGPLSLGRCAVGDGARPKLCVGGAVGAGVRCVEDATAGVTPKAGGDIGVAGRVGGVSHLRAGRACDASGGAVRRDAPAQSRGVGGRPKWNSLARARSGGAEAGRVGIGGWARGN